MNAIDELIYTKLGWTWVIDYASILLIVAAALVLILLITLIAVAACHGKNKRKFRKMQAEIDALNAQGPVRDEGAYRAEVRAEIEPIIRAEIEREYAGNAVDDQASQAKIQELNKAVQERDSRINELGAALAQANSAHKTDNTELYRTINDLNQDKRTLQNDINILRAENAQLKSQQTQTAVVREQAQKRTTESAEPVKSTAVKRTAPVKQPAPAPEPAFDDDDDEDEYYDDYGDETSAIKVTLKYDRMKANWVIYRSDTTRAYRRFATKQEALNVAKDLARRLHAQLVVHKKDGKFQKI